MFWSWLDGAPNVENVEMSSSVLLFILLVNQQSPLTVSPFSYNLIFRRLFHLLNHIFLSSSFLFYFHCYFVWKLKYAHTRHTNVLNRWRSAWATVISKAKEEKVTGGTLSSWKINNANKNDIKSNQIDEYKHCQMKSYWNSIQSLRGDVCESVGSNLLNRILYSLPAEGNYQIDYAQVQK